MSLRSDSTLAPSEGKSCRDVRDPHLSRLGQEHGGSIQEAGTGFHFCFQSYHLRTVKTVKKTTRSNLLQLHSFSSRARLCILRHLVFSIRTDRVSAFCSCSFCSICSFSGRKAVAFCGTSVAVLLRDLSLLLAVTEGLAHLRLKATSSFSHPQKINLKRFDRISEHYKFLHLFFSDLHKCTACLCFELRF